MAILLYVIKLSFTVYTVLLFVSVIGSWFPSFSHTTFMRFVRYYTNPYLNVFRRLIPPIGGVLDLSPLLAFFGLRILETIIVNLILS